MTCFEDFIYFSNIAKIAVPHFGPQNLMTEIPASVAALTRS